MRENTDLSRAAEEYQRGSAALSAVTLAERTGGALKSGGEKQELETAWTCFKSAAEAGYVPAMERLAFMYEHFENDKKTADEWYRKAVNPSTQKGDNELSGNDDLEKAYAQYMDGFEEPSVTSNYVRLDQLLRVAVCRYFGLGTVKDTKSAETLMHYAVYERHCAALADIYMKMITHRLTLEEAKKELRKKDPYHTTEFEKLMQKDPVDARTDNAMIWGTAFVTGNTTSAALHANSFKYISRLRGVPQGTYRMFTKSIAFEGCLVIRDYPDKDACCTWKAGLCREGGNGRGYYREGRYVTGVQEGPWSVYFDDGRVFRLIFRKGNPTGKAVLEKDGKLLWKGEISDSQGLNTAVRNAGLNVMTAGYDALLSAAKNTEMIIAVRYLFPYV